LPRFSEREVEARRLSNRLRTARRWDRFEARVSAIKQERGCADCGFRAHPAALHFDHLPGTTKRRGMSRLSGVPWEEALAEIAKCEVVCANCHAIRTAERRHVE
jgi:hypothetical protein